MIKLCAFADESSSEFLGQIDALKRNNISLLEIRGINGKSVIDQTDEEIKECYERLCDNNISVWSIGSPIGKVHIDVDINAYLDTVKRTCEISNKYNCDKIRMFSFFYSTNDRSKVLDYLSKFVEVGKEFNVKMCHENEKGIYGDNLERVKDILLNVKDLDFVYDPANFIQVGEKAEDTLSALHKKAYYFHIKDVIAKTDELVPAGYGDGMIDKLVSMITDDKVLTLEPHLKVFEGFSKIDDTVMKNKFEFNSNEQAFDFAVKSLKDLLSKQGYKETEKGFIK